MRSPATRSRHGVEREEGGKQALASGRRPASLPRRDQVDRGVGEASQAPRRGGPAAARGRIGSAPPTPPAAGPGPPPTTHNGSAPPPAPTPPAAPTAPRPDATPPPPRRGQRSCTRRSTRRNAGPKPVEQAPPRSNPHQAQRQAPRRAQALPHHGDQPRTAPQYECGAAQ